MSRRLDNTRVVTFKEDYFIKGRTTPLYSKDKDYAIHHSVVEKIKNDGAKISVKLFDEKGAVAKAKKQLEESKKKD